MKNYAERGNAIVSNGYTVVLGGGRGARGEGRMALFYYRLFSISPSHSLPPSLPPTVHPSLQFFSSFPFFSIYIYFFILKFFFLFNQWLFRDWFNFV